MTTSYHRVLAIGALLVAVVGLATALWPRTPSSAPYGGRDMADAPTLPPQTPDAHAPANPPDLPADWNEIDLDFAAGTQLPSLPTPQPEGMSVFTADQALAKGLARSPYRPLPDDVSVRLLNNGIYNNLCGDRGGLAPDEDLLWVVALSGSGATMKDVLGPYYSYGPPPFLFDASDPHGPTPTPRLSPTPMPSRTPQPVAGIVVTFEAGEPYSNVDPLFDADGTEEHCPSLGMIRALRSLPGPVVPVPTPTEGPPIPTPSIDGWFTPEPPIGTPPD